MRARWPRVDPAPGASLACDDAFAWLTRQPYGWLIVAAICVGLLGYALFCFVNAAYRFVPKVIGGDIATLAARAKAKLRLAT